MSASTPACASAALALLASSKLVEDRYTFGLDWASTELCDSLCPADVHETMTMHVPCPEASARPCLCKWLRPFSSIGLQDPTRAITKTCSSSKRDEFLVCPSRTCCPKCTSSPPDLKVHIPSRLEQLNLLMADVVRFRKPSCWV